MEPKNIGSASSLVEACGDVCTVALESDKEKLKKSDAEVKVACPKELVLEEGGLAAASSKLKTRKVNKAKTTEGGKGAMVVALDEEVVVEIVTRRLKEIIGKDLEAGFQRSLLDFDGKLRTLEQRQCSFDARLAECDEIARGAMAFAV